MGCRSVPAWRFNLRGCHVGCWRQIWQTRSDVEKKTSLIEQRYLQKPWMWGTVYFMKIGWWWITQGCLEEFAVEGSQLWLKCNVQEPLVLVKPVGSLQCSLPWVPKYHDFGLVAECLLHDGVIYLSLSLCVWRFCSAKYTMMQKVDDTDVIKRWSLTVLHASRSFKLLMGVWKALPYLIGFQLWSVLSCGHIYFHKQNSPGWSCQ